MNEKSLSRCVISELGLLGKIRDPWLSGGVCEEVGQGPCRGVGCTTTAPVAKAVLSDLSGAWDGERGRNKKSPAEEAKGMLGLPQENRRGWVAQTKLETRVCLWRKRQWLSV